MKATHTSASSFDIRSGSVRCVSSKLNPLDFKARNKLCKALHKFFKEAKQYLPFGKCQSEDFDAQIAGISIVISVYLMLTLRKRFQAYEGLGKIFIDVQNEIIEFTLWERIWGLFLELQMSILKSWDIDLEKVINDVILDESLLKFLTIILEQQSEKLTSGFINKAA